MNKIPIAKIGKSYGVRGWQKIHLLTDFPEQFKAGETFESDRTDLTIEKIDLKRALVKFKGVETPEDAKKLTNRMLYTTVEETKKNISLKDGEYFWFDIIGCDVYENGELNGGETLKGDILIGRVKEIERANAADYLIIQTDKKLQNAGYPKRVLIDFKRNVKNVDIDSKKITATGALELLESLK